MATMREQLDQIVALADNNPDAEAWVKLIMSRKMARIIDRLQSVGVDTSTVEHLATPLPSLEAAKTDPTAV